MDKIFQAQFNFLYAIFENCLAIYPKQKEYSKTVAIPRFEDKR